MSSEQPAHGAPGIVIVGVPPGAERESTRQRYAARGYLARVAEVDASSCVDTGVATVRAAMDAVALQTGCNGKIAVAGYGYGGRFAFLAVTRLGADAAVAFRGSGIGKHLAEAAHAKKPLSFHFDDADESVPFEEVRAIKGALEGFGTTEIYRYAAFDAQAQAEAERRAFAVLDRLADV